MLGVSVGSPLEADDTAEVPSLALQGRSPIHQVDNATSGHLEPIGLGMDPVKRENLF